MAIGVYVLGKTGTGKSTSLRNLDPRRVLLLRGLNKRNPFKGKDWEEFNIKTGKGTVITLNKPLEDGTVINAYGLAMSALKNASKFGKDIVIIDDFQAITQKEVFDNANVKGYDKFTFMAKNVWDLLFNMLLSNDNTRVYLLSHTDENENGEIEAKTFGKMFKNNAGNPEGLVNICLRAWNKKDEHYFTTVTNGADTVKTPIGMFASDKIDNDLSIVDKAICEYYEIEPLNYDEKKDIVKPKKEPREEVVQGEVVEENKSFIENTTKFIRGEKTAKEEDEKNPFDEVEVEVVQEEPKKKILRKLN